MSALFLITPERAFLLGGLTVFLAGAALGRVSQWRTRRQIARVLEEASRGGDGSRYPSHILRGSPSAGDVLDRQLDKLDLAFCEGVREATDLMAVGAPLPGFEVDLRKGVEALVRGVRVEYGWRKPDEIQARLTLARNTASRAKDLLVVARCAGRIEAFEVGLGVPEDLARMGYQGPIASDDPVTSAWRVLDLRRRADQYLRAADLTGQQRSC